MHVEIRNKGSCTFEEVVAEDLLDAVRSLKGGNARGVLTEAPGVGVDQLMAWAVTEIEAAQRAGDDLTIAKHASSAVRFARQSVACQIDWYLNSWSFCLCRDAPKNASVQAELLVRRGVIDNLTARVVERAVAVRNEIEHKYSAAQLSEAEDAVELMRRTVYFINNEKEPQRGVWLFGNLSFGQSWTDARVTTDFHGWLYPAFVVARFYNDPWLGVILPAEKSRCRSAHVRRAFFRNTKFAVYEQLLGELQLLYPTPDTATNDFMCRLLADAAGLGE